MTRELAARAWIHGSSRDEPLESGFGVLLRQGTEVRECAGFLGRSSQAAAEQSALIAALTLAQQAGCRELDVLCDSEALISRLSGGYRVTEPELVEGSLRVLSLRRKLLNVSGTLISAAENQAASSLANRAIDQRLPAPEWA